MNWALIFLPGDGLRMKAILSKNMSAVWNDMEKRADHYEMLEHYKRLILIDTGAYSLDDKCFEKSFTLAKRLGLRYQIEPGSLNLLQKLLTGPWDDDFVVLQSGTALSMNNFRMDLTDSASNLNLFGFGMREADK